MRCRCGVFGRDNLIDMGARSLLVLCFALAGCEALFGIRETSGRTGAAPRRARTAARLGAEAAAAPATARAAQEQAARWLDDERRGWQRRRRRRLRRRRTPAFYCNGEPMSDFCADFDGDSGTYRRAGTR